MNIFTNSNRQDAHRVNIKKKMTKGEFLNNTRSINSGSSFPKEFMEDLYDRIVNDEIKMETEGKGKFFSVFGSFLSSMEQRRQER